VWDGHKLLKTLARPRGFEPLTFAFGGQSAGFAHVCLLFVTFMKPSIYRTILLDRACFGYISVVGSW
jgi:hypothetical protein